MESGRSDLVFKVGNYGKDPIAVAFEPTGMSFELAPGSWFTINASGAGQKDVEIIHSPEAISLWLWGDVVVLDSEGNVVGRV